MTISGTDISMVRGDTESITLNLTEDAVARALVTGDKVYFTVKKYTSDTTAALQKLVETFTDAGAAVIAIAHADTESMAVGAYWYDIQITFADGTVKTVVGPALFTLTAEVTYE
jgi:hypothetical protein